MARKVRQMRGKGNHTGLVPVPSRSRSILPISLRKVVWASWLMANTKSPIP